MSPGQIGMFVFPETAVCKFGLNKCPRVGICIPWLLSTSNFKWSLIYSPPPFTHIYLYINIWNVKSLCGKVEPWLSPLRFLEQMWRVGKLSSSISGQVGCILNDIDSVFVRGDSALLRISGLGLSGAPGRWGAEQTGITFYINRRENRLAPSNRCFIASRVIYSDLKTMNANKSSISNDAPSACSRKASCDPATQKER